MKLATPIKNVVTIASIGAVAVSLLILSILFYTQTRLPKTAEPSIEQKIEEAKALGYTQNKYTEAIALLEAELGEARSMEDKYKIAAHLGTFSYEQDDYEAAIKYYKEAEKNGGEKNVDVLLGIANASAKAGYKTEALSYYQKVLVAYKEREAVEQDAFTALIDGRIKNLEGSVQ